MLATNFNTHPADSDRRLSLVHSPSRGDIIGENSKIIRGNTSTSRIFCGISTGKSLCGFKPFKSIYRQQKINILFENRLVSSQTKMENLIHQLQQNHLELSHYLEEQLAADNEAMNSFLSNAKNTRKTISESKNLFDVLEYRYDQISQACHAVMRGNYAQLDKLREEITSQAPPSSEQPEITQLLEQINFISDHVTQELTKDLLKPLETLFDEISKMHPQLAQYLQKNNREVMQKKLDEILKNSPTLAVLETKCNRLKEEVKFTYDQISQAFLAFQQVAEACKRVDQDIQDGIQDPKKESPHMSIAREGLKKIIYQCDQLDLETVQLSQQISEKQTRGVEGLLSQLTRLNDILEQIVEGLQRELTRVNEISEQIKIMANETAFLTLGKKQDLVGFITTFFHEKALKQILGDGAIRARMGKTPYELAVKSVEHFNALKKEFEIYWSEFLAMSSTTSTTTDEESVRLFFKDFVKNGFCYVNFKNLTGKDPSDPRHLTYEESKELLPLLNNSGLGRITLDSRNTKFGSYLSFLYYRNSFDQDPILLSQLNPVDHKLRHTTHNSAGSGVSSNNGSDTLSADDIAQQAEEARLHPGFIHVSILGCWGAQSLEYYKDENIVSPRPDIQPAGAHIELAFSKNFYNCTVRAYFYPHIRTIGPTNVNISPYHSNLREIAEFTPSAPKAYERGSDHRIFFFYRRLTDELVEYKG